MKYCFFIYHPCFTYQGCQYFHTDFVWMCRTLRRLWAWPWTSCVSWSGRAGSRTWCLTHWTRWRAAPPFRQAPPPPPCPARRIHRAHWVPTVPCRLYLVPCPAAAQSHSPHPAWAWRSAPRPCAPNLPSCQKPTLSLLNSPRLRPKTSLTTNRAPCKPETGPTWGKTGSAISLRNELHLRRVRQGDCVNTE